MVRVLVTGAGGLLSSKLTAAFSEEYEVVPTQHSMPMDPRALVMNIVDRMEVFRVISEVSPQIVVHAAAATEVDKCETNKEWAWNVNAIGTKNVAEACSKIKARLIYVSTDYVFDGTKGLYNENDETKPINYYGLTKLQGEEFVKQLQNFVIARTSVIYGWHPRKLNFATWVIDSLRNRKMVSVVRDHYNSPTLADDLAKILEKILRTDECGIYHAAGSERVSRYEFALKIAEVFELDRSLVKPVRMEDLKTWIARRPRDSSLSVDKLKKQHITSSDLAKSLQRMKSQI